MFNQGRHLWSLTNENQGHLDDPGSPPTIPFPQFVQGTNPTFVEWLDSDLSSSYNGLQISVDKRMANNFAFHVAYTWSKALSQGSDFEAGLRGIQDRYNLNKEWGLFCGQHHLWLAGRQGSRSQSIWLRRQAGRRLAAERNREPLGWSTYHHLAEFQLDRGGRWCKGQLHCHAAYQSDDQPLA